MTPKGGGGRSWGPIRAENQHAENLAKLLRAQVDASGKTLRDLESEIKVSKAQVGVYLAGKIPDDPFIIAVIEATVPPALRERRTNEALYLRKQALVPSPRTPSVPPSAPGPGYAVEQAAAQARQLETYDRLTRALEQQAEVERAKNNSDKLVMILLNMIHQLDRRVSDLVRERDELRDRPRSEALEDAERKLARAEEQEERARTELQRAEEKQRQAEKLQTRLQDQLRQLTDELDRLRAGDADSPINTLPTLIYEVDEGRRSSDPVGDDIDAVLARATTVNDEDNDTLTRVTSQLNEAGTNVVQDNPPDNASTEDDGWWVVSGDEHPDSLHTRLRFAVETAEGGDPNRAVDLVNGLIPDMTSALGADHPDTLTARHNAATWAGEAGDATGAAADLADLIPRLTRALGPDHPNTHTARHEAAHWAGQAGDATGAAAALADLINDRTRLFGPNHPGTLLTRHEAARWAGEAGNIAGAAAAFADLVSDRTRVLGPDHPDTLRTRHSAAHWAGRAGDTTGAAAALADLINDRTRVLGRNHPDTLLTRHEAAHWAGEAGDATGAAADLADLIPRLTRALGPDHPNTLRTRHSAAHWAGRAGDTTGAAAALADLINDRTRVLGPNHPDTLAARRSAAHWAGRAGWS